MKRLALFLLALPVASPALAGFPIRPGMELTMTIDDKGEPIVTGMQRADLTAQDRAALAELVAMRCSTPQCDPVPLKDSATLPKEVAPVPGKFVVAFVVEGKNSLLVIRNGYDKGLVYRARITVKGRESPTDVCLVMPMKRGYEHWPYPITQIDLSEFSLRLWKLEDGLSCA